MWAFECFLCSIFYHLINKLNKVDLISDVSLIFILISDRDQGIDKGEGRKEEKCIFDIDARV